MAGQDLHVVVFDVNVYLNVAALLGPPFTWEKFRAAAAANSSTVLPCATDSRIDSLRAIATTTSGRLSGDEPLQVWTSDHIDDLVFTKATQPTTGVAPEDRGLGWSDAHAEDLLTTLVETLVYDLSEGGSKGEITIARDAPPLSHEDGCVYATTMTAGVEAEIPDRRGQVVRYCVTSDKQFRNSKLTGDATLLYPYEWVKMVRRRSSAWATARLFQPR